MRHRANQKTWADEKGNLVPDGDPGARVLAAREGQEMSADDLARFPNASEFFPSLGSKPEATQVLDELARETRGIEYEEDDEQDQPVSFVPSKKKNPRKRK